MLESLRSPRALLAVFAIVVGLTLLYAASSSTAAFSAHNAAWNGTSGLAEQSEAVGVPTTTALDTRAYPTDDAEGTVAVVLSPDSGYDGADRERVRRFVRNGGTLVVAEDLGSHANPLLSAVGAQAQVDGRTVRDERYHYRSPSLPYAYRTADHPLTSGVAGLTLNYGTPVEPNGATPLVSTSSYAYVDGNGNGELDAAETMDSRPVATVEQVGQGRVVVVGDPSIAINAMLDREGNRAFVRNLFRGADEVVLDQSHSAEVPPLARALRTLRRSVAYQFGLLLAGIAAVGLWVAAPEVWARVDRRIG